MLKRQRPVSPAPPSDVPLVAIDISHQIHEAKRRRILAPILDGEKRGWAIHRQDSYDENELEEEVEQSVVEVEGQWRDSGMYKSTNSFLYDLHALHQHRLNFSRLSTPSSSNQSNQHRQPSLSQSSYSNTLTKPTLPLISKETNISSFDDDFITQKNIHGCNMGGAADIEDGTTSYEVQRVKERYEDTNR